MRRIRFYHRGDVLYSFQDSRYVARGMSGEHEPTKREQARKARERECQLPRLSRYQHDLEGIVKTSPLQTATPAQLKAKAPQMNLKYYRRKSLQL